MLEFAGLWKHQDNPACTKISKSVSLQNVKSATIRKTKNTYIHDWDIPKVPFKVQTYKGRRLNYQNLPRIVFTGVPQTLQ